jgi:hypothetical protein
MNTQIVMSIFIGFYLYVFPSSTVGDLYHNSPVFTIDLKRGITSLLGFLTNKIE